MTNEARVPTRMGDGTFAHLTRNVSIRLGITNKLFFDRVPVQFASQTDGGRA